MSHYFENDNSLVSNLKKTTVRIFDRQFVFYTDNGVFAKSGLDFGSRLLLESIPLESIKGTLLDVGCGYGPLGIILNKICRVPTEMVDINKRALHLAKKNAKENQCEKIEIYESNCYEKIGKTFDVIVTNPPIRAGKKVVYDILLNAKNYMNKNGTLYFVVRKEQGAKSIISDLKEGYDITILKRSKGFFIIQAKSG